MCIRDSDQGLEALLGQRCAHLEAAGAAADDQGLDLHGLGRLGGLGLGLEPAGVDLGHLEGGCGLVGHGGACNGHGGDRSGGGAGNKAAASQGSAHTGVPF